MLVNFRFVLVNTMMMDSHHHLGVWKTLTILRAIFHVYYIPNFATPFVFSFIMIVSLLVITSSPLHRLVATSFLVLFLFQHFHEHHTSSPSRLLSSQLEKLLPNRLSIAFLNLIYNNSIVPTILVVATIANRLKRREKMLKAKVGR